MLAGGLEIVAKQAVDNNPQFKKAVIEPLKKEAENRWNMLSPAEKRVIIGFGVGTLGIAYGAFLGTEEGRKYVENLNLVAPLQLNPMMPVSEFSYALPKEGAEGEAGMLRFKTKFTGTELLKRLRDKRPHLPPISLDFSLDWGYDAQSDDLRLLGGQARFGILKGISLSAGTYKTPPAPPETYLGFEGQLVTVKQRLPGAPAAEPQPGFQIMLTVDLLKLDKTLLPTRMRQFIEGF